MSTRALTVASLALVLLATAAPAAAQAPLLASLSDVQATPEREAPRVHTPDAHDAFATALHDGRTTRGFADHRVLHFTFDDGPRPSTTPRLLDTLNRFGVRATFFVVARQLEGNRHSAQREIARDIVRRGHTLGSHTYDHANLTTLDTTQITRELTHAEEIFMELFGVRPWLMRPPYGARTPAVDRAIAARGYTTFLWNITASDEHLQTADEIVATFQDSLRTHERHRRGPGGIVLLHDTQESVIAAFPRLIGAIHARNCELRERGEDEELWDVVGDPELFFQARDGAGSRATTVVLDPVRVARRQLELRAEANLYCPAARSAP